MAQETSTNDFGSNMGYNVGSRGTKRSGAGTSRVGSDSSKNMPRSMNDAIDMLDDISGRSVSELRDRFLSTFGDLGRRVSEPFRGLSGRQMAYIGLGIAGLVGAGIYWSRRGSKGFEMNELFEGVSNHRGSNYRAAARKGGKRSGGSRSKRSMKETSHRAH